MKISVLRHYFITSLYNFDRNLIGSFSIQLYEFLLIDVRNK